LINRLYSLSSPASLLVVAALFGVIYAVLLVMMRCFDQNDITIIKAAEKKTGVRLGPVRDILKKFL